MEGRKESRVYDITMPSTISIHGLGLMGRLDLWFNPGRHARSLGNVLQQVPSSSADERLPRTVGRTTSRRSAVQARASSFDTTQTHMQVMTCAKQKGAFFLFRIHLKHSAPPRKLLQGKVFVAHRTGSAISGTPLVEGVVYVAGAVEMDGCGAVVSDLGLSKADPTMWIVSRLDLPHLSVGA